MSRELFVVGDVHGKFPEYRALLRLFKDNPSVQIGDMGIGFFNHPYPADFGEGRWFFRGNHDNPDACHKHPNHTGDNGYSHDWNLSWVAGAYSVDWAGRTPGIDWWENEELSEWTLRSVADWWTENQPRIVLTHDAPYDLYPQLIGSNSAFGPIRPNRTANYLSEALHKTKWKEWPKLWIFGHHHQTKVFSLPNIPTKFMCLNELDFVKIDVDKAEVV